MRIEEKEVSSLEVRVCGPVWSSGVVSTLSCVVAQIDNSRRHSWLLYSRAVQGPTPTQRAESDTVLPANIRKVALQILGKYCKVCWDGNNDIQMEISSCNSIFALSGSDGLAGEQGGTR